MFRTYSWPKFFAGITLGVFLCLSADPLSAQDKEDGSSKEPDIGTQIPGQKGPEEKKNDKKKEEAPKGFWETNPPYRVYAPSGAWPVLPSGQGYYSLCDWITKNYRENPPQYGYPRFAIMGPSFFDADFRYLDSPKYQDHDHFDPWHRIHLGDQWLLSTGGQFFWRYMNETGSRLTGRNNDYHQFRTRVFADLWYCDAFRAYVEFIDARSHGPELAPLPIDNNRGDLLNAFIDAKIGEIEGKPVYVRVGRQELLFGSQRLVSTIDWTATRRTFQGVRAFRAGEKFDVDLFWVQPVAINATRFDSVDNNQNFAGLWTTYRPKKGHFLDMYYLFLDHTRPPVLRGETAPQAFNVHTFGTRYTGDVDKRWLWDVELNLQFGERGRQDVFAGASAVDLGYHFKDMPWNPTFWVCHEFASGDRGAPDGTFSTFNPLFPFGHYYFGFLDLVGRQNIHDIHTQLYLYPTKWITVWLQYHHFELASSTDALYNAGGVALRRDVTGRSGTNVGDEIDVVVNFHLDRHSDILFGYSKLFSGEFIRNTGSPRSPELFYAMYSFRW